MMKSFRIGALALATLASAPAYAAAVSFVSVRGTDTGNCAAITTPCRTFAYALGQTSAQGEIFAITPGDYGPVTINKSISITGTVDGAGINTAARVPGPFSGFAHINIAAGAADLVYLTGLTLDGGAAPAATSGVGIVTAGRVIIRKCFVRNYSESGEIAQGSARLLLEDDALSNNADNIVPAENVATVVHRVSSVNARRAAIEMLSFAGLVTSESSIAGSVNGIRNVVLINTVFLTGSSISGNQTGVAESGNLKTAGNNLIRGNGTNVSASALVTMVGTK